MTDLARYLGISPALRLRLAWARLSARLFCWTADHAPCVAAVWAFRDLKAWRIDS